MSKQEASKVQIGTRVIYEEKQGVVETKRFIMGGFGYLTNTYIFDILYDDGTRETGVPHAFVQLTQ